MDEPIKVDAASQRRMARFQKDAGKLLVLADRLGLLVDILAADGNPARDGVQAGMLSTNHDHPDVLNHTICVQTQRLHDHGYRPHASGPVLLPIPDNAN